MGVKIHLVTPGNPDQEPTAPGVERGVPGERGGGGGQVPGPPVAALLQLCLRGPQVNRKSFSL